MLKYLLAAVVAIGAYKAAQYYYMVPQVQIKRDKLVPFHPTPVQQDTKSNNSVIRIKNSKRGMCSASVISDDYALTAAHCVSDERGRLVTTNFDVYNDDNVKTDVKAEAVALDHARDIALVKGDFTDFHQAIVENHKIPLVGMKLLSCGFGADGDPGCTVFVLQGNLGFQYLAGNGGLIFQGFSGGPVLAENPDGEGPPVIVAVNSAVSAPGVLFGPIYNFEAVWDLPKN